MAEPLYITFLWHMHQPYYKDPMKGEYALPWTYLHAIKDYYDMAAIVETTPGAKVVFNLVPSLLDQIVDYATGAAQDPFLVHGRMAPADMGEEERHFVVENFFSANRQRMIEPYRRYLELFYLAGEENRERRAERLRNFRDQEILDLQVWFYLAWTGEAARRAYPELQELLRKGRNFTEADKDILFAAHRKLLQEIIPIYKRLHESGKAELAVSPYFHPILPLLCDIRSAQTAMPRSTLPSMQFRCPEDARSQVVEGIACFREQFGFTPAGMWPSEGSVSDAALTIIAEAGLKWAATDEGVLVQSLPSGLGAGRDALYQPYRISTSSGDMHLFFRDHALSDLIGFTYSQWDAERAVADFLHRISQIRTYAPGSRSVAVILDGENAWEYYANNGNDFLTLLYKRLAETAGVRLATFSEVMERVREPRHIDKIHPGSWINANYGVWIGHPEENLGWDYLAHARETAVRRNPCVAKLLADGTLGSHQEGDETARQICRSIYAAEGSDWFWWYGDDHFSPHSDRFDTLFRRHLMNVYRLLGEDVPRELLEPIKKKSAAGFVREPAGMVTPVINGLVTDYFEWLGAGLYDLTKQSSAMHAAENLLQSFYYGFDRKALYFRIDGVKSLDKTFGADDLLTIHLILERESQVAMRVAVESGPLEEKRECGWQAKSPPCVWRIARVCELRVPLELLNPEPGSTIFAYLTLTRGSDEIGRWPTDSPMILKYAGPDIELENWLI